MKVVNTVIKKLVGTVIAKIADTGAVTTAQTATKLNDLIQDLKDREIIS